MNKANANSSYYENSC